MAVKKTLIVSDVHLKVSAANRPRQDAFVQFLRGVSPEEYQRLICLGDLFDFWFEYRHAVFSGYFDVLCALAALRDGGVEMHLVCGNHDFWAGRFLEDTIGMQVHRQPVTMDLDGYRAHFAHGDGINPEDRSYRLYKRFARNRLVIGAFRLLHPDWAMAIAQFVSHGSRTMLQEECPEKGAEAEALKAYAQDVLARGEADAVLCGHAHAPIREEYPTPDGTGVYINTGDWMHHRTYAVWDGEGFDLRHGEGA